MQSYYRLRGKLIDDYKQLCDHKIFIEKWEKKIYDKLISISSIDDYMIGKVQRERVFWINLLRMVVLINMIRWFSTAIIQTKWIKALMSDPGYLMGNPVLFPTMIGLVMVLLSFCFVVCGYQELTHTMDMLIIFRYIRDDLIRYPLSKNNLKKWSFRLNILTIYADITFWPNILVTMLFISVPTLMSIFGSSLRLHINQHFFLLNN